MTDNPKPNPQPMISAEKLRYNSLADAYARAMLALMKAERVLSALPPAYCRPTILSEVRDVIADTRGLP